MIVSSSQTFKGRVKVGLLVQFTAIKLETEVGSNAVSVYSFTSFVAFTISKQQQPKFEVHRIIPSHCWRGFRTDTAHVHSQVNKQGQ